MILDGLLDRNFPQQPIVIASISYFISLFLLNFIRINYVFYVLCIFLLFLLLSIIFRNITFAISFVFVCISCVVFSVQFYKKEIYFNSMKNKNISVVCYATDYPFYTEDYFRYTVQVEKELNNDIPKFKMNLYSTSNLGIEPFQKFKIDIHTHEDTNIKHYLYLKSQGIYLSGNAISPYNIEYLDEIKNIKKYLFDFRAKIVNYSTRMFDSQSESLVKAFLFGDKKQLNHETKELFYKSSVSHLLAISGFHFSLLIKILYNFLKLFKFKKKYLELSCIIFIIFFTIIVGFHPSSLRAGIMLTIYFLAKLLFLSDNSLNSLGVSLLVILLINPNSCTDIGLILSFLSSISIILFNNKISNKIFKNIKNKSIFLDYIISNISDSISVSICTLPVTCIYFKYLNSLFIFSNLIIQSQLYAFFVIILISIFYSFFFSFDYFNNYVNIIVKLMLTSLEKFSHAIQINLDYSFINLCISSILIVISFSILFSSLEKSLLKITEMSFIFFSLGIISYQLRTRNSLNLKIINSKDILLSNEKESILIFESKNFDNLFPYLNNNSYKIDIGNSKIDSDVKIDNKKLYKFYAFNNRIKISIFTINNNMWIRIKLFDKIVLICPNGADAVYLPENLRKCNIFIAFKLPNRFDIIQYNNIIYASDFNLTNYSKLPKECLVSNQGNVYINFKNNGYTIRRNF